MATSMVPMASPARPTFSSTPHTLRQRSPSILRGATSIRVGGFPRCSSGRKQQLHVRAQSSVGTSAAFKKLQGLKIIQGTDGAPVDITTTWYVLDYRRHRRTLLVCEKRVLLRNFTARRRGPEDKVVVVWLRSFG
jgi:hypothetical protein